MTVADLSVRFGCPQARSVAEAHLGAFMQQQHQQAADSGSSGGDSPVVFTAAALTLAVEHLRKTAKVRVKLDKVALRRFCGYSPRELAKAIELVKAAYTSAVAGAGAASGSKQTKQSDSTAQDEDSSRKRSADDSSDAPPLPPPKRRAASPASQFEKYIAWKEAMLAKVS